MIKLKKKNQKSEQKINIFDIIKKSIIQNESLQY